MQIRDAWIEIWSEINRNMRCIEMYEEGKEYEEEKGLIET